MFASHGPFLQQSLTNQLSQHLRDVASRRRHTGLLGLISREIIQAGQWMQDRLQPLSSFLVHRLPLGAKETGFAAERSVASTDFLKALMMANGSSLLRQLGGCPSAPRRPDGILTINLAFSRLEMGQ